MTCEMIPSPDGEGWMFVCARSSRKKACDHQWEPTVAPNYFRCSLCKLTIKRPKLPDLASTQRNTLGLPIGDTQKEEARE